MGGSNPNKSVTSLSQQTVSLIFVSAGRLYEWGDNTTNDIYTYSFANKTTFKPTYSYCSDYDITHLDLV